jgi:5'-nucleotidase (lipoprotein e(P4) family)
LWIRTPGGALSRLLPFVAALAWAAGAPARESAFLNATLWIQRAPEARGAILSLFRLAELRLDEALRDSSWTAAPFEQAAPFAAKAPAVIPDVDETVLDTSPCVARLAARGRGYDGAAAADWGRWVRSARAAALPGAAGFIRLAPARQMAVYFVSKREDAQEEATRRNLRAAGIETEADQLLLKGGRPDWTSDKGARRRGIAREHRVLLLLGDSLEDFVDGARADALTGTAADPHAARWGREWIPLLNPMLARLVRR